MTPMSSESAMAPQAPTATTFHADRTHLIGAAVMALISLLVIGAKPLYLFWILALPALFAYWVIKSKTVVDEAGITAHYAFKKPQTMAWGDFAGIRFAGSGAYARNSSEQEFSLPGVTFNSLPKLSVASQGRIVDALTAGRDAAHDKVVVYHRDGRQILKRKDEV
ncbi:PH domain-containing protein [Corynebacterium hindlerae]|uniref:PH domain-containing protein n=2 Tax=Corynebacterium hindlerae TaxID=699041 RepID=A0A7G5FEV1_9CORY|nr:PH domain-containing protein [Corynebacterium hindlerae]QTH58965.1 PH domain-containing protein [Corynebacterium hindlerae]